MVQNYSVDEEVIAYHEAGHAVVGAVLNRPPNSVSIIPDEDSSGRAKFPNDFLPEFRNHLSINPKKVTYIETRILTRVAGTIASGLQFPQRAYDAADAADEQDARRAIMDNAVWADNDRDGYYRKIQERANYLLQTNWPWVEAVARALIKRKVISTAEVMELRPNE